tara:strand:- start:1301 stop:2323 length:1023 start_codon:yes stop_codon:yes gene_type:complete
MKIAYFYKDQSDIDYIREHSDFGVLADSIDFIEGKLDNETIPPQTDYNAISVFVHSEIDRSVLDAFPNLKFITTRSTGYDHIDIAECGNRGIAVSNVPDYGKNTVAEFTFALMLAVMRKVYRGYNRVRETGKFTVEGLEGVDLGGKTLGVIGTGSIGRNVINIAKGFGMNVIATDVNPDEEYAKELGFEYKDLDTLFSQSDVVTFHVPYSENTHHMLNKENIMDTKPGAFIINTSRGGVIETEALVYALENKHLAGAALDVLEEEGIIKDEQHYLLEETPSQDELETLLGNHILIDMPNVIITPHNAFNTKEAKERILDTTVSNLLSFQDGNPINKVVSR